MYAIFTPPQMRLHGPMFQPLLKKGAWLSHLIGEKANVLHAIVARLHEHEIVVVILTQEMVVSVGVRAVANPGQ